MLIRPTEIPDVLLVEPRVFGDARGFFLETFQAERYPEAGLGAQFVQDNHSRSVRHTLRGLHYQIERPQGKLLYVVRGSIWDVAVDLRQDSPTFGRWIGAELSDQNHRQMYVPPGFAHGFCVTSETADVIYKCTDYYFPQHERTILWSDPELEIRWPTGTPILSDKDRAGTPFSNAPTYDRMDRA